MVKTCCEHFCCTLQNKSICYLNKYNCKCVPSTSFQPFPSEYETSCRFIQNIKYRLGSANLLLSQKHILTCKSGQWPTVGLTILISHYGEKQRKTSYMLAFLCVRVCVCLKNIFRKLFFRGLVKCIIKKLFLLLF